MEIRSPGATSRAVPSTRPVGAPDAGEDVGLADGTTLHLRPLEERDDQKLFEMHRRLSRASLNSRFMGAVVDCERYVAPLTRVGDPNVFGLVGERDGRIVAAAHCVRDRNEPHRAEIAFVTEDGLQGQGIGTRMLSQLADSARRRGVERLEASVLRENSRMLHVLARSGLPLERKFQGSEIMVSLRLTGVPGMAAAAVMERRGT